MTSRSRFSFPVATVTLVALMIYAFTMEMRALRWGILASVMNDFSFSWTAYLANPSGELPKMVSHTFLHANLTHLVGNLLFFVLFAPAVEREVGHATFVLLYLAWGVAAAVAQGFFEPYAAGLIGASGAISGAAGAYLILFPLKTPSASWARWLGKFMSSIPAFFWIGLWFLAQVKGGFRSLTPDLLVSEPVAYWAHVGGFAAGALSAAPFLVRDRKKVSV